MSPPPRHRPESRTTPTPPPSQSTYAARRAGLLAATLVLVLALVALVTSLSGASKPAHHASVSALSCARRGDARRGAHAGSAASSAASGAATLSPAQAVAHVRSYTPFVKEGGGRGRDVALTFDDGPGPSTPRVLDVLERMHVHATFFVIGVMLRYFSASATRELRDGDVIGDHTETHPEMALLPAHEQHEQLFEQMARVELLGGPRPRLFRPPYGSYDATTMRELRKLHLLMVLWSVDTDDYLQPGVSTIVQRALAGAHPGAIILMHDAGGTRTQTIEALPHIIRALRARGYDLVTVPQLLAEDPPPPGQPLPPNLSGD
jgi:peptidoglycan-N-acetylglucosamine deacetylase